MSLCRFLQGVVLSDNASHFTRCHMFLFSVSLCLGHHTPIVAAGFIRWAFQQRAGGGWESVTMPARGGEA